MGIFWFVTGTISGLIILQFITRELSVRWFCSDYLWSKRIARQQIPVHNRKRTLPRIVDYLKLYATKSSELIL